MELMDFIGYILNNDDSGAEVEEEDDGWDRWEIEPSRDDWDEEE